MAFPLKFQKGSALPQRKFFILCLHTFIREADMESVRGKMSNEEGEMTDTRWWFVRHIISILRTIESIEGIKIDEERRARQKSRVIGGILVWDHWMDGNSIYRDGKQRKKYGLQVRCRLNWIAYETSK